MVTDVRKLRKQFIVKVDKAENKINRIKILGEKVNDMKVYFKLDQKTRF